MFSRIAARFASYLLNKSNLSLEDRNLLTVCLLDKLAALPLRDMIITNEEGKLIVNGRPLTVEACSKLRESARAALDSYALNLIREQVAFTAITDGINKAVNIEQMYFSKAAIWVQEQEIIWLKRLAQQEDQ